jgi:hypothetical protein
MESTPDRVRWGLDSDTWHAAVLEARVCLESCARSRRTIAYSELCRCIHTVSLRPYSWALMALLCEVASEVDVSRGLSLAALVVRRDTGMPGEGYFAGAGHGVAPEARESEWRGDVARLWDAYGAGRDDPDSVVM